MSKTLAQENIEYILRELLKHKDCVSMSNSVKSDGSLYSDVVEDIENYLNILKETA
jgi:hypothetical protein